MLCKVAQVQTNNCVEGQQQPGRKHLAAVDTAQPASPVRDIWKQPCDALHKLQRQLQLRVMQGWLLPLRSSLARKLRTPQLGRRAVSILSCCVMNDSTAQSS